MNIPRQPFVGLTLMSAFGILVADFVPISTDHWLIWAVGLVLIGLVLFRKSNPLMIYAFVGFGFFLIHIFRTTDTPAMRLAQELGERTRTVRVVGIVANEPRIASNGIATFLLDLESIEFEGRAERTNVTLLVHWRGNSEFGDELKLFGAAEPIAPPRNPGEFDMRSYLERQDVRRGLFVRYPEDGALLRKGAGNPILSVAQESRVWLQRAICSGLDDSPDVQNFLGGIALGLRHQTHDDIEEPFQQTGTLHLFAVAGLHVGIVARLLWTLAIVARLSRRLATALIHVYFFTPRSRAFMSPAFGPQSCARS
jgi:competence protein ComEC